jgi:hypothetical protein
MPGIRNMFCRSCDNGPVNHGVLSRSRKCFISEGAQLLQIVRRLANVVSLASEFKACGSIALTGARILMKHHLPYLSAQALGIEAWERDELIALWPRLMEESVLLDMTQAVSDCGSVCCIGGHIALANGISVAGARRYVQDQAQRMSPLASLFYPDLTVNHQHEGWRARGPQAARAIVNFLTRGTPDWQEVMQMTG